MGIKVVCGDYAHTLKTCNLSSDIPPDFDLKVGIDVTAEGGRHFRNEYKAIRDEVTGVRFHLEVPEWATILDSQKSRSTSHARYVMKGNIPLLHGRNMGVLLQVLPAGKETSCHHHEIATECFIPLFGSTDLYTEEGKIVIPRKGLVVPPLKNHQLVASLDSCSVNIIFMIDIKEATYMGDHHEREEGPFVAYTPAA